MVCNTNMHNIQTLLSCVCRLTHDWSVVGRPWRVFHDDELEDGEGEKRRDAEGYLLTAVRRQPEHRQ